MLITIEIDRRDGQGFRDRASGQVADMTRERAVQELALYARDSGYAHRVLLDGVVVAEVSGKGE